MFQINFRYKYIFVNRMGLLIQLHKWILSYPTLSEKMEKAGKGFSIWESLSPISEEMFSPSPVKWDKIESFFQEHLRIGENWRENWREIWRENWRERQENISPTVPL